MDTHEASTIRDAHDGDAAALALLATHMGYPTEEGAMRRRLARISARPDHRTLVAERGGRAVGFTGVMWGWGYNHDEPYARIVILSVEPDERGKGTGALLVAEAERWAREQGAASIHVTTALHREGAHRFYERIGYAQTGLRYYKKLG
jgi:GNAT superfamily N-acetyltransferase